MNTLLLQNNVGAITVFLSKNGTAVTGLTYADILVDLKKGAGDFVSKAITSPNFTDLSGGFYSIATTTSDASTVGNLLVRITGNTIDPALEYASVVSTLPTAPSSSPTPAIGILFGWLLSVTGDPLEGSAIVFSLLSTPSISTSLGAGTSLGRAYIRSDSSGFFAIPAPVGTVLDVIISDLNYRRTVTVPSSSTNLFLIG